MQDLRKDWEELAETDPFWAILVDRRYKHHRWPVDEFFKTGEDEVAEVLGRAKTLGYPLERHRALDFGCGVGRLSRALSTRFDVCVGIDISSEMVKRARQLIVDRPNCEFLVNSTSDLNVFESGSFDFVYSSLVLQHMPRKDIALRYIGEFLRVVRPGGLVAFQLPYSLPWTHTLRPKRYIYRLLRGLRIDKQLIHRWVSVHPMTLIAVAEPEVRKHVEKCGGIIYGTDRDSHPTLVKGIRYYIGISSADK